MAVEKIKRVLFGIGGGILLFLVVVFVTPENQTSTVEKLPLHTYVRPSSTLVEERSEADETVIPQNINPPANQNEQLEHQNEQPQEHQNEHLEEHQNEQPEEHQNEHPEEHRIVLKDKKAEKRVEPVSGEKVKPLNTTISATPFAHISDDLKQFAPEVFKKFPTEFDSKYKSPCWHAGEKLHCLPYFYQIGMPKCGTTDLWDKIIQHPDVKPVPKEPHWWARRRLGWKDVPIHPNQVKMIRKKTGTGDDRPFEWYVNWFDEFAVKEVKKNPKLIFGDGSVTTSFYIDNQWKQFFPDAKEPPYVLADLMHALQPNAKIVVILREPVSRMYSAYLYVKGIDNVHFDGKAKEQLSQYNSCIADGFSEKYCVYQLTSQKKVQIYRGMYSVFLSDWLGAYGKDQVLVVRLDDWIQDPIGEYKRLCKFLNIRALSDEKIRGIVHRSTKNSQSKRKEKAGKILPQTEKLLKDFYRPWNQKLADLLNDTRYLWDY